MAEEEAAAAAASEPEPDIDAPEHESAPPAPFAAGEGRTLVSELRFERSGDLVRELY